VTSIAGTFLLDEACHAVKDRLSLVDLHAPQGVDAMADEYVGAVVDCLVGEFRSKSPACCCRDCSLVAEGILVAVDRHDHEVPSSAFQRGCSA